MRARSDFVEPQPRLKLDEDKHGAFSKKWPHRCGTHPLRSFGNRAAGWFTGCCTRTATRSLGANAASDLRFGYATGTGSQDLNAFLKYITQLQSHPIWTSTTSSTGGQCASDGGCLRLERSTGAVHAIIYARETEFVVPVNSRCYHDYVVERADSTFTKPLLEKPFTGSGGQIVSVSYVALETAVNDPATRLPNFPNDGTSTPPLARLLGVSHVRQTFGELDCAGK